MQLFLDQQQFQVQINTHLLPPLRQQDNGGLSQKKYNAHVCDDNMSPSATVHMSLKNVLYQGLAEVCIRIDIKQRFVVSKVNKSSLFVVL